MRCFAGYLATCLIRLVLLSPGDWLYYRQALDAPTLCGLALIAAGIVLIQLRGGH